MLVADIHHVSINIEDLPRSLAFYSDTLGLRALPRPTFAVDGAWLDAGGGRQVHLIVAPVPPDQGQHFAFLVDDMDATVGALTEAGVKVRGPFQIPDSEARQAFFFDPDGNRLEINQPY